MNYKIDTKSNTPAYLQLYECLRRDIISGVYPCGSKLPSKRTITAETGVSVITVQHAIALLCDEGYVEAKQRSGLFVIFREGDFQGVPATAKKASPKKLQPHTVGDFSYDILSKTIRRVLLDYGEKILIKAPNHGCTELREEICSYLARSRGIRVKPSQVIIGAGAEYLYSLIAQLYSKKNFALEYPYYDKIRKVYEAHCIKCDMLKLLPDGIDSDALRKTKATVLHTTPFNSFPTGTSVGARKKHEYLSWAKKRNALIIEDNYDSELTVSSKAEDTLFAMSGGKNVIYLNTFSMTVAPSVRVGYMILPSDMVKTFHEKLGFYSCSVPVLSQYVLAELLRSGDFERHIIRVRRKKRRELN